MYLPLPFDYKVKPSDPDEIQICCPFCEKRGKTPDTKYHLYIHLKKKVFHCFRCEASGRFRSLNHLLELLNLPIVPSDSDLETLISEVVKELSSSYQRTTQRPAEIDLEKISMPITPELTPIAYKYLQGRKLNDEDIQKFNVRCGKPYREDGRIIRKWQGRVIFPLYDKDSIVRMVVGRSYTGKEPKYLNSKGNRSTILFGLPLLNGEEVILCEGIFSAISAYKTTGIPAVASLGKAVSEQQIRILRDNGVKRVYVALDGDVSIQDWRKAVIPMLGYGLEPYPIFLPHDKDPDDLGEEFPRYLEHSIKNRDSHLSQILGL